MTKPNHSVIARRPPTWQSVTTAKITLQYASRTSLLHSFQTCLPVRQVATECRVVYFLREKFIAMTLALALLLPCLLTAQTRSASDIYGEGVRAFYSGDYPTALQKYSEALALKPNTIGYLYSRGLTYQKLYKDSSADIDFQAVIKLNPKYLDAWYGLGMVQMDQKNYDSAQGFFSRAILISPGDVRSLHQLGLISYYKHKYFDAIGFYDRILKLSPDDQWAYYQRGLVKFADEDYVGAAKDFSDSYRINPENTLALEQRALSYLRNNDLDNACLDWNILLKMGNNRVRENINLYCGKK